MNDILAIKTIGTIVTMWGVANSCLTILNIINTSSIDKNFNKNYKTFWFQYVSSISLFSIVYGMSYSLMKKI